MISISNERSFFLRNIIHIVKHTVKIRLALNRLLNHPIELLTVLAHQSSSIPVQWLFQISSFDVLKQMQQSNNDQMQFINRLPPSPKQIKTHISVFVDIRMQNFVETFHLRLLERIFLCSGVRKSYPRVTIVRILLIWEDYYVQLSHRIAIGETQHHVVDLILVVVLNVVSHPPLSSHHLVGVLFQHLSLLFLALSLEFTYHTYINQSEKHSSFI